MFSTLLSAKDGVCEVFQPTHSYEDCLARSRIDRFYLNQHYADNLHKDTNAWASHFPYDLSHQRPICMRRKPRSNQRRSLVLTHHYPLQGIRHFQFQALVEKDWGSRAKTISYRTPLEQLKHYTVILRKTAHNLASHPGGWQPVLCEDSVSIFMRAIQLFKGLKEAFGTLLQR